MKVIGLCGVSGAGKTHLAERLIAALRGLGCRVSVIKHAHKGFEIDRPGKDSYRHREAGAYEVLVASSRRFALVRSFEHEAEPTVHDLLAQLADAGPDHWVLVEGFKHADLPKIEVWREGSSPQTPAYVRDPHVVAIAHVGRLPSPTLLPVFDLDDAAGLADFLRQDAPRYEYHRSREHTPPAARP